MTTIEIRYSPETAPETVHVQSQSDPETFYRIERALSLTPRCECKAAQNGIDCTHVNAWLEYRIHTLKEEQTMPENETTTAVVPVAAMPKGMTQAARAENQRNTLAALAGGYSHALELGGAMLKSGLLPESIKTPEMAAIIIQTAVELDVPPNMAFQYIQPVKGKPFLMARMCGALIQRSGKGYVQMVKRTPTEATAKFVRYGERGFPARVTDISFTMADAVKAGLTSNKLYQTSPANMLWARVLTTGAWMVFPDVMGGMDIYDDELETAVIEDNEVDRYMQVVQGEVRDVTGAPTAAPSPQPTPAQPASNAELLEAVKKMVDDNKADGWTIADVHAIVAGTTRNAVLSWLRLPERSANPVDDLEMAIGMAKLPPVAAQDEAEPPEAPDPVEEPAPPAGEAVAMEMTLGDDEPFA